MHRHGIQRIGNNDSGREKMLTILKKKELELEKY